MPKTEQLQIRVSPKEKALIRARAAAAGMDVSKWVLRQALPPLEQRFQQLCAELVESGAKRSFVLAEINDFLSALSGTELVQAVHRAPEVRLPRFEAAYLAAMVELAAALREVAAPAWTGAAAPLDQPWFASSLSSLRLHLLVNSPPPFRRRNLFVDSSIGDRV